MHNKKAQAWKRNSRPALLRLNILLSIQLDADVTVFVNDQFHVADVLIIELFSFFFCHACVCRPGGAGIPQAMVH